MPSRIASRLRWVVLACVAGGALGVGAAPRAVAYSSEGAPQPANTQLVAFDPAVWPRTDAELGFSGTLVVEDFEDATLADGLLVQLFDGSAPYGPTATVPHVFDPAADDPNGGQVLAAGAWSGTHVLLNRQSAPVPFGYVDGEWADVVLVVPGGACRIGFSLQQLELPDSRVHVETDVGTTSFRLGDAAGFSTSGGRCGYVRIDAGEGRRIFSVRIDNLSGDGWALDHVVYEPATALPAPLVAHWRFDETSGATARDSVGTWDGTLVGSAHFVQGGISGNALALERTTNDHVSAGAAFPSFVGRSFTVSAWVRTASPQQQMVVTKHTTGVVHGYMLALNTIGPGYGTPDRATFYASNVPGGEANSSTVVDDGAWHHVVGVYRVGVDTRIYVDGAPAEQVKAAAPPVGDNAPLLIGGVAELGTPTGAFSGLIDDVQIYAGALVDEQIEQLFAAPGDDLGGTSVPPVTAYFLPKSVAVKVKGAGKDSLRAVGVYDDGGVFVDYDHPVTVTVGGFQATVPLTSNASRTLLRGSADGVSLTLRPNRFGSSRGLFVLSAKKVTLGGLVDPDAPLDLRLDAENLVDAVGRVQLTRGKFRLGGARGSLTAPTFFPTRVVAKLSDSKPDVLQAKAGFHADSVLPEELGTVLLGLGPDLQVAFDGADFVEKDGVFTLKRKVDGTSISVRIDFVRELLTVTTKGLELGALDGDTTEFVFDPGDGSGTQRGTIRLGGDASRRGY